MFCSILGASVAFPAQSPAQHTHGYMITCLIAEAWAQAEIVSWNYSPCHYKPLQLHGTVALKVVGITHFRQADEIFQETEPLGSLQNQLLACAFIPTNLPFRRGSFWISLFWLMLNLEDPLFLFSFLTWGDVNCSRFTTAGKDGTGEDVLTCKTG